MAIASARERALIAASLAVFSALLSNYLRPALLNQLNLSYLSEFAPGLWFALVLVVIGILWSSRSLFDLSVLAVGSLAAWGSAYWLAIRIEQYFISLAHPPKEGAQDFSWLGPPPDYTDAIAGIVAGFLGAVIVIYFTSAVFKELRTVYTWTKTILLGAVAGSLLECLHPPDAIPQFLHMGSTLPVFLAWQIAVGACIAFDLAPRFADMESPTPPSPRRTSQSGWRPRHSTTLPIFPATAAQCSSAIHKSPETTQHDARPEVASTLEEPRSSPLHHDSQIQQPIPYSQVSAANRTAFGFGIAALVFAILAIFFPFGIILSAIAIVLAVVAGGLGDRILSIATALIALVNTFVLSPSTWILLSNDTTGLSKVALIVGCLLPAMVVLARLLFTSSKGVIQ